MEITVNGEARTVPAGLTVAALLTHLEVPADRVAIELNRRIVRKGQWGETLVDEGAEVEIVMFVGGGK
ncbi:MAG: sulfur carrier protein ThiS [Bryobacterales bacterium]|nr:sulfur carrier protein ThiS [Bryobacterales bacterium]